jgi:hypothetical protein
LELGERSEVSFKEAVLLIGHARSSVTRFSEF